MSRSDVLVDADWVEAHIDDPGVVIAEIDEDTSAYDKEHIRNAIKLDWKKDLQDPVRRDFIDKHAFEELLSARGITNDDLVILYGGNNNWFAAYAYWYFRLYGHNNVKLLDGGRKKWELDSRDLVTEVPERPRTSYHAADPDLSIRAFRDEVIAAIGQRNLVDVRSPDEFSGRLLAPAHLPQEQAQRPGHIPTAKNVPWSKAANDDGTFKSDEDLHKLYADEAGLDFRKDTIAYCRIGERSAHTWFVLHELLGQPRVKNYDGSWTEYGSLVAVPIEVGVGAQETVPSEGRNIGLGRSRPITDRSLPDGPDQVRDEPSATRKATVPFGDHDNDETGDGDSNSGESGNGGKGVAGQSMKVGEAPAGEPMFFYSDFHTLTDVSPGFLDGKVTGITVIDPTENETTMLLETDEPFVVQLDWQLSGPGTSVVGGDWHVTLYIDDIDGVSPTSGQLDAANVPVVITGETTNFSYKFQIPASRVEAGMYQLSVVINHTPAGAPADVISEMGGYAQTAPVQVVRPVYESNGGNGSNDGGGAGAGPGSAAREPEWPKGAPPSRYLSGEFPVRAPAGKEIDLLVRVVVEPTEGIEGTASAALKQIDLPPQGALVIVVVSAPGLTPLNGLQQPLLVPAQGDSEPVRFPFRAGAPGLRTARVTAWLGGTFLGELALQVSVEAGVRAEQGFPRYAAIGVAENTGEVTLQVRYDQVQRQYMFQLLSSEYFFDPYVQALAGDPSTQVERTAATLKEMAANRSAFTGTGQTYEWLYQAGVGLWTTLVPDIIKEQFWQLHDSITAFSIATDRDIIPWELLYPLARGRDNGFLVEQFPVMRRVYNQGRQPSLRLTKATYIVPPQSPTDATSEVEKVRAKLGNRVVDGGVVTGLSPLNALLAQPDFDVLHFACHNTFKIAAGGSSVALAGGPFQPLHLNAAKATHALETTRPLVFFNACRSAGEVVEYTELMGWASRFMAAGSGAFLGTLWAVRSSSAIKFAEAFYSSFLHDGATLGEAVRQARLDIKSRDDPTWLAYTAYGNPSAIILIADAAGRSH